MLTHGNVVADFSGFLKVTDVSDWDPLHTVAALLFPFFVEIHLITSLSCRKLFSQIKMTASFPSCRWLTCLRGSLR